MDVTFPILDKSKAPTTPIIALTKKEFAWMA